jgi:hypothetical protein
MKRSACARAVRRAILSYRDECRVAILGTGGLPLRTNLKAGFAADCRGDAIDTPTDKTYLVRMCGIAQSDQREAKYLVCMSKTQDPAEQKREASELARASAEATRLDAELRRVASEVSRDTGEKLRRIAEDIRQEFEMLRKAAESSRAFSEQARIAALQAAKSAERALQARLEAIDAADRAVAALRDRSLGDRA